MSNSDRESTNNFDGGPGDDDLTIGNDFGASSTGFRSENNLLGGEGDDTLNVSRPGSINTTNADGGDGNDEFDINAGFGGTAKVTGGEGDDDISVFLPDDGEIAIDAGGGKDKVDVRAAGTTTTTIDGGDGENDIQAQLFVSDIARRGDATLDINGGAQDDNVSVRTTVNNSDVAVTTGDGNDKVDLEAGPGVTLLGDGSRPLFTRVIELDVDANFEVNTGAGNDEVTLKTVDSEVLSFRGELFEVGGDVNASLTNSTTGDGNDVVQTSTGDDSFDTGAGADQAEAGGGADDVSGGSGSDLLKGQGGNDNVRGGEGDDQISGGGGDDVLFGEAGSDIINGGTGADSIFAGAGRDRVVGGEGADTFVFGKNNDLNIVFDFGQRSGDNDRIDLTEFGITASEALAAAETTFIGGQESTTISLDGGSTEIQLFNVKVGDLSKDDFIVDDAVG